MAYHIQRSDRSPRKAMRRIAAEQLAGARADLVETDAPPPEAIHDLRKRIKKLRGLLRLVAPQMSGYRPENKALRDAGRVISGLRDAAVRRRTLEALITRLPDFRPTDHSRIAALLADPPEEAPQHARSAILRLRDDLEAVAGRVPDWKISGTGFAILAPGLRKCRERARQAMAGARRACEEDFDATPFHEWRKRVKTHWYQARILAPIWPKMMTPHCAAADALGELLGDHNDIDVLIGHLRAAGAADESPDGFAALERVALETRREHARAALSLGCRLFAGTDEDLTARWGVWWQAWHAG